MKVVMNGGPYLGGAVSNDLADGEGGGGGGGGIPLINQCAQTQSSALEVSAFAVLFRKMNYSWAQNRTSS